MDANLSPCKGKSFQIPGNIQSFCPYRAPCWLPLYPGRCPGLGAFGPSARTWTTCETSVSNIEKTSRKYGIILIFCGKVYIVMYFFVSIRFYIRYFLDLPLSMCSYEKKVFFMKKCQSIIFFAERKDKWLTYNKIEEWYILDYLTRSIIEVSLIW